jgi:hypothetical protein
LQRTRARRSDVPVSVTEMYRDPRQTGRLEITGI